MGSRGEEDDRTMQFPLAAKAQQDSTPYERLATTPGGHAPESDEKPTLIAASPSQSMLLVADPAESDDASAPSLPHPADDEPDTMLTRAPAPDSIAAAMVESVPETPAETSPPTIPAPAARALPESRPRLPTPRMDLRMYTPASIGPTALTLAPPTPSSMPVPRMPIPFPRFDEPAPRQARLHPVAWIAVGVLLGAAAMAAINVSRGTRDSSSNAAPASANMPAETDLDKVAPMPSAKPAAR